MSKVKKNYKIVRTYSAGVFAGELVSRKGQEVKMKNARRLWYWRGSASLSEMAIRGVSCPTGCKFCVPVTVELLNVIEILSVTQKAFDSISGVKEWTAH